MTFDDDVQIVPTQANSGTNGEAIAEGKILVKKPCHKPEAPQEECIFKVMLELTGAGTDRHGLDLVMVLDISGSMGGEKLEKMKKAVQFVIKKLSPVDDRLSVVTFRGGSKRRFPLLPITRQSQKTIEDSVDGLVAKGSTNIAAGLQTGLQVLKDRRLKMGRAVAIMLMSDGQADPGKDATNIAVGKVPVHTFGFGQDHDPKVLSAIAGKSPGGTFSDVGNPEGMTIAFSQCLAGLLTVAVRDLKLTVTKRDSEGIKILSPLGYPQSENKTKGSITISFGDLYIKEVRLITVELLLSAAVVGEETEVLRYSYSYRWYQIPVLIL